MLFPIIEPRYWSLLLGVKTDCAQFCVRIPADPLRTYNPSEWQHRQIGGVDTFLRILCFNVVYTDPTLLTSSCEIRKDLAVEIDEFEGETRTYWLDSTWLDSTRLYSILFYLWLIHRIDRHNYRAFRYFNSRPMFVVEKCIDTISLLCCLTDFVSHRLSILIDRCL